MKFAHFFFVALIVTALGKEIPPDVAPRLMEIYAAPFDPRLTMIQRMSQEERLELLKWARVNEKADPTSERRVDVLFHLGDEETTRQLGEELLHGDAPESIAALSLLQTRLEPRIIELIAPTLFYPDGPPKEGIGIWERSYQTADCILQMLRKTPGFTGDVYNWCDEASSSVGYYRLPVMRKWWKENEAAFRAGDYKSVKRGEIPPPIDSLETSKNPDGTWGIRVIQTKATPDPASPSPNPIPDPPRPEPSVSPPVSQPDDHSLGAVAAIVSVFLVVLGAILWKYRSTTKLLN